MTSTQIAPIANVSTYGGPFGYESLWRDCEAAEREAGRVVCRDYDLRKMGERLVEEANRVFEEEKPLAGYGVVEIRATEFISPREYNFMSDWLALSVKVDGTFFGRAGEAVLAPENRKAVVRHCRDRWVSRDGFVSFMLNRVRGLSLGLRGRASTDEEIEEAVVADLREALALLESGTSPDETRDFGAVLALLWRFAYPGDFDSVRSESWSGSWVADRMEDGMRSRFSLSDFCTVLDEDEVVERFGGHMVDFGRRRREFKADLDRYRSADFADKARIERLCELLERGARKVFGELEASQTDIIAGSATGDASRDRNVNDLLDAFREEEVERRLSSSAMARMWREARDEAR